MVGVGVAVGPISGGWLLEHFDWGSIFLVNLPIAAVAVIGGWLFIPTSRDPATPPIDFAGLILSAVGVTALVYTIIEAPNHGWASGHTIAGFAVAAVVIAAFIWWEQRRAHPILDLSVFRDRRFSGGSLAITAGFLTLFGFIFVITQYFQFIKGYSAFETGVRLLPVAASIAIASILGPRIVEWIGTTIVVAGGLAIFGAGLGWASTASASTPYLEIAIQMVLLGAGLGLTTAPGPESIMGSLSADKAGVGSAVNDTTRELGGTLGVAIVGSVFASIYSSRLADSPVVQAMPEETRAIMGESMAAAQQVIAQLPPAIAPASTTRSKPPFSTASGSDRWSPRVSRSPLPSSWRGCCPRGRAKQCLPQPKSSRTNQRGCAHDSYTDTWTDGHGTVEYFTRSDGSRLRYFTAGTGPALVLMHTIRTQLDYFHRVIPQLWDSFTVYAWTCPAWAGPTSCPARDTRSRTCGPRWSSSSPASTCTTSRWPGNHWAERWHSASIDLKDRVSRVVAFNSYDYPSGLERGNLFARFIISSVRMPGSGRSSP